MRTISTTSRRELSSSYFFPARQGAEENSRHSNRDGKGHAPPHATVKHCVTQFKRGDFNTCFAPRPGRLKTVTTPDIIDHILKLILEDPWISAKSIDE